MMIEAIGYSSSHAVPGVLRIALSVPPSRLRNATQRNATIELGRIQAISTSVSTIALTALGTERIVHAMRNPRMLWPTIADPKTKMMVSHSELRNDGSASAAW